MFWKICHALIKQSAQKKGERKEQYGWTQVEAKRRNQDGRQQEEQEQIKYSKQ
jgi:hypothetical protein